MASITKTIFLSSTATNTHHCSPRVPNNATSLSWMIQSRQGTQNGVSVALAWELKPLAWELKRGWCPVRVSVRDALDWDLYFNCYWTTASCKVDCRVGLD